MGNKLPKIRIEVSGKVIYLSRYKALKLIEQIEKEINEKYIKPFWEKSNKEFPGEMFIPKSQQR